MWWSNRLFGRLRRAVAILMLASVSVALSACGFHPLYASQGDSGSPIATELASISISGIKNRDGQILRNLLLERLSPQGQPLHPHYVLSVRLTKQMTGIAYQKDASASGGELYFTAYYALHDNKAGRNYDGAITSVISVNYLGPRYASVVAERDAENQALTQIANSLQDRLATLLYHKAMTPAADGQQ